MAACSASPHFNSLGMQHDPENAHMQALNWVNKSARAGQKWMVGLIEANPGVRPDAQDYWQDRNRKGSIWGNLMAGGSGSVFFFTLPNGDINCEDFRSRDHLFDLQRHAHTFFTKYLPVTEMRTRDDLTPAGNDYVFAKDGQVYAIYIANGNTTDLDLSGLSGAFEVRWYDPRYGGELQNGTVASVEGGAIRNLGFAPEKLKADWVALVRRPAAALSTTTEPRSKGAVVGPNALFHVKLNNAVNTKTARKGDRIRAVVMSPVPQRGGYVEGVVEEASGNRLRLTFNKLQFRGKESDIATGDIVFLYSSKGNLNQDDFEQRVRFEGGTIVATGPATSLDEGAELRFRGGDK